MRRLIVSEFITLDGVIEDPGGAEGSDFGGFDEYRLLLHPIRAGGRQAPLPRGRPGDHLKLTGGPEITWS